VRESGKQGVRVLDLLDALDEHWLKLPHAAMRECGPAAQTLAGLLEVTNRETFAGVGKVAHKARVPTKTARNHLAVLVKAGWVKNNGRQRTRHGRPRRTCTLAVTAKTVEAVKTSYAVLPWWACGRSGHKGTFAWSEKALLAVVMARLMRLRAIVRDHEGQADLDPADIWASVATLGGPDRFRFSLPALETVTGLRRQAIIAAKRRLHRRRIINWSGTSGESGKADVLEPNPKFTVVVTPAGQGCRIELRGV
jgi:hypothetical protein